MNRDLSLDERIRLEQRLLSGREKNARATTIPRRGNSEPCDPSFAQSRLWLVEQISSVRGNYHLSQVYRIRGAVNADAVRAALDAVVARHEALRTRLVMREGVLQQQVEPHRPFELQRIDLRDQPERARESALSAFLHDITQGAFDLSADCMLRAGIAWLGDQECVLAITLHHIAADGWSLGVLDRELEVLYAAFGRGVARNLPPLPIQYADYAVWQRGRLSGTMLEEQLGYWREQLSGVTPLEFPADRPRPAQSSYRGEVERFRLPTQLVAPLKALARRNDATLYMTLLAAFQVLLMRYTGQEDIAIGSPVAGRDRPELDGLIGFFVNTLVMRGDLSGNPSFAELLARTRTYTLDAYAHQEVPFEKLVEALSPERDLSRNPLFQVMFALQNTPETELQLHGLRIERVSLRTGTAKFDLLLSLAETNGQIDGVVEFSTDLFDAATIARMAGHFATLLAGIVAHPETPIGELPLLTAAERDQLLVQWNDMATDYPRDRCTHQLFEEQAARAPDNVAVQCEQRALTYAEINRQANRLAHYLRTLGIGPESLVGLCVERSTTMVVGMLAILKAGGAYVPLAPDYPRDRLRFMLEDSHVTVVLTQSGLEDKLPAGPARMLSLDTESNDWKGCPDTNPAPLARAEDLAYVMYTSGSTGTPKGVMVPHRAINRLVCNTNYIQLDATDGVAQVSNASFDAATFEIWGALLNGSRLTVIPRQVALDPVQLVDTLRRGGVSTVFLTTALFNAVVRTRPNAFVGLKQVLFGGEAVAPRWVRACLNAGAPQRLLHVYGPTETTTFATWCPVEALAPDASTLPIGRPIANTVAYVLDRDRQPVPVGVAGELYIGGDGLARGYWNRPDLTAERFVPDPFSAQHGARLYRTGDRVRYLPDGNLEFLGRLDNQVKLRGFRIELGEIEAVLVKQPQVREAIVQLREDTPGDPRLAAYVVTQGAPLAAAELRTALKQQLPDYMIPAAFVQLPALPLTPNGKIDRDALPAPEIEGRDPRSHPTKPSDNIERHLTRIWEVLLKREPIGLRDNFFDLGGHSLLAVQLMDQIEKTFQRRLPLDSLWFRGGTIEALAALIGDEFRSSANPELVVLKNGSRWPLFVVHTMGGNLFHYYELARHMHADQAVYGLQARGGFGTGRPDCSIEAIAAQCLESMRAAQPCGPYMIAGYSSGGVVAYEMAQQLTGAGEQVALVALLDTYAPQVITAQRLFVELARLIRHQSSFRGVQELAYFIGLHRLKLDRLRELRNIGEAHRWAHWSYRPKPYPHPVELFIAEESANRARIDGLGWSRWVKQLTLVHEFPDSHGSLVKLPVVAEVAARLQARLDNISAI